VTAPWVLDAYRPGDEAGINALFERVFGTPRSVQEWRWKFLEGPDAERPVIRLARSGGRIVGQYAVVFTRFLCGGRVVRFAQPVDNMIHPGWRGGLGRSRMQRALFQAAEGDGRARTAVGYGFPGREHYRVGKKLLGYEDLASIDVRFRWLTRARHVRRLLGEGGAARAAGRIHARVHEVWLRLRARGLPEAAVRRVPAFDARFDSLWARASGSFGVIAVRDRAYLTWRYGRRPGAPYAILALERGGALAGYAVLAVREHGGVRRGRVADLLCLPEAGLAERLVQGALAHFLRAGCDLAECWSLPGSAYGGLAARYFPRVGPEPVRAVFRIYDPAVDASVVRDPARWHLTLGDSDGV